MGLKPAGLICVVLVTLVAVPAAAGAGARDDTAWLQAQLDAGGSVFLPKLPNGECYATRGLWVSRDGTTIRSDGACIVGLGPGEARMKSADGRPIRATSVFHIDHSNVRTPLPVRISISDLRIDVPVSARISGVRVFGHEVTLSRLTISGSPLTDVVIGSGAKGLGGMTARVEVNDCVLTGGRRDVITAYGPIGLRIEGNTLSGARGARGYAAAGLHVRAADRGQPTLDVRVARNRIAGNAGPGIYFDLAPANGTPVFASGIEVTGNDVRGNARTAPAKLRGGIVLAGGQRDGKGALLLTDNVVRGNRGAGVVGKSLRLLLSAARNDVRGNSGGATKGLRPVSATNGSAESEPTRPPASAGGAPRDDTRWLQARLDRRGGTIFLPKLPGGECYATRGLWVSHDGTTITSDGACVVSLGLGAIRLRSNDGDPIASSAVFFVNRSHMRTAAPVGVTISNLRILVPDDQGMDGVAVFGHATTLNRVDIGGFPRDDVLISGRANGNSYVGRVAILDSTLSGAKRNAISATGVIDLRVEGNVIQGVRDVPPGQPAAGIDLEPDDRGQPAFGVRIFRNTIQDNAGPGILLELESNEGLAVLATGIEITDNTIVRNALKPFPPKRAGVVLAGGQDGGAGTLLLRRNVIRGNGGPGILGSRLRLLVDVGENDVVGNSGGATVGLG